MVADIDEEGSQATVRRIDELGGRAIAVALRCDPWRRHRKPRSTATVEAFGRLHYAFNNAGAEQQPKPTADITEDEWDRIIAINLRTPPPLPAQRSRVDGPQQTAPPRLGRAQAADVGGRLAAAAGHRPLSPLGANAPR